MTMREMVISIVAGLCYGTVAGLVGFHLFPEYAVAFGLVVCAGGSWFTGSILYRLRG